MSDSTDKFVNLHITIPITIMEAQLVIVHMLLHCCLSLFRCILYADAQLEIHKIVYWSTDHETDWSPIRVGLGWGVLC